MIEIVLVEIVLRGHAGITSRGNQDRSPSFNAADIKSHHYGKNISANHPRLYISLCKELYTHEVFRQTLKNVSLLHMISVNKSVD